MRNAKDICDKKMRNVKEELLAVSAYYSYNESVRRKKRCS